MTVHVKLYSEKADKFEEIKAEMGPEGVELSNSAVVMRLIESHESSEKRDIQGGLAD
jgi:hypothetical protein